MKRQQFTLHFSDDELARGIFESTPPPGIKVSGNLNPIIRASAGMEIVWNVNFDISVPLTAVAVWIIATLKKRPKNRKGVDDVKDKTARINDQNIALTPSDLRQVIKQVLYHQELRENQWRESQKEQAKRRLKKQKKT